MDGGGCTIGVARTGEGVAHLSEDLVCGSQAWLGHSQCQCIRWQRKHALGGGIVESHKVPSRPL